MNVIQLIRGQESLYKLNKIILCMNNDTLLRHIHLLAITDKIQYNPGGPSLGS